MSAVVFVGPTLALSEARDALDAEYRPPAARGDVYRAARQGPRAIGLIDGVFALQPSVWHKELLWAMSQGVHVFGSASMGALRAAELAPFGMEGIGAVYEAYRRGALQDDDEVAVIHGSAERGYAPLSEALVNIRATLDAAACAGVVAPATAAALTAAAKALFYPDRTYPRLLAAGVEAGLPHDQLAALQAWLPLGQVDQKRTDARQLLAVMRQRLATGLEPKRVRYNFEETVFWQRLRRQEDEAG